MPKSILDQLNERISELETQLFYKKAKMSIVWNNNTMDEDTIKDKIIEYSLERDRILAQHKEIEKDTPLSFCNVSFMPTEQHIHLWSHVYSNFEWLFQNIGIKDAKRKTQLKGWLSLIYAIVKNGNKDGSSVSELLPLCLDFKANRNNRTFENKWATKKKITKTDCESANAIFKSCGVSVTLSISKDETKITIHNQ